MDHSGYLPVIMNVVTDVKKIEELHNLSPKQYYYHAKWQ